MAEALEERGTQEVVDRNLAIEALKKEVETLEAEKSPLVAEVRALGVA
jgi:cell division protein FtsB